MSKLQNGMNSYSQDKLVKAKPKDLARTMTFDDSLMNFNLGGGSTLQLLSSGRDKGRAKIPNRKERRRTTKIRGREGGKKTAHGQVSK